MDVNGHGHGSTFRIYNIILKNAILLHKVSMVSSFAVYQTFKSWSPAVKNDFSWGRMLHLMWKKRWKNVYSLIIFQKNWPFSNLLYSDFIVTFCSIVRAAPYLINASCCFQWQQKWGKNVYKDRVLQNRAVSVMKLPHFSTFRMNLTKQQSF